MIYEPESTIPLVANTFVLFWLFFVFIAACKYVHEKRQQEKQQAINALPPILRPKTKTSRELSAVAKFQQKVRPRRYIDTFKFSRKKWARKEVALNPFLYGKKDELSEAEFRRQSPLKTQRMSSSSDPNEGVDGASHIPAPDSLVNLFAYLDVRDGAAGHDISGDYSVVESDLETSPQRNGLRFQKTKGEVSSKSAAEKPAKKVWAKEKVADRKAEKGKKWS